MASFGDQIDAARRSHLAVKSLESSVRQQVATAIAEWEYGVESDQSIRHRLENIVRNAYRTAAAVGGAHAMRESGMPEWVPSEQVFTSDYLSELLKDVRRNLRTYKAGPQQLEDRRRLVTRVQHSAGVAATRGYTDAVIKAYIQLEDMGFSLRKLWMANFNGNTPCAHCRALHGTETGLREEFPVKSSSVLKVYQDLTGPPRHPRCQCFLVVLIVTLENAFESLDIERPKPAPTTMTTEEVKSMPFSVFRAVVVTLQKVIKLIRGKK
jgi:hypothetical protein